MYSGKQTLRLEKFKASDIGGLDKELKEINSFDEKEFDLDSVMGSIIIKGSNLEMIKLDTIEGNVSIKGQINSFTYSDTNDKESSILAKLFK